MASQRIQADQRPKGAMDMTRSVILASLLLLPGGLLAQTPAVVYTRSSPSENYLAAHSDAKLIKTESGNLTFQHADGSYTLLSGSGLSYQQDGQWVPTKLQIQALSDGSGWTLAGTAMAAKLTGPKGPDKQLTIQAGPVALTLDLPQLVHNGA